MKALTDEVLEAVAHDARVAKAAGRTTVAIDIDTVEALVEAAHRARDARENVEALHRVGGL